MGGLTEVAEGHRGHRKGVQPGGAAGVDAGRPCAYRGRGLSRTRPFQDRGAKARPNLAPPRVRPVSTPVTFHSDSTVGETQRTLRHGTRLHKGGWLSQSHGRVGPGPPRDSGLAHPVRGARGVQADWVPLSSGARPKRTQRLSAETWDLLRLPLERVSQGHTGPMSAQLLPEHGQRG